MSETPPPTVYRIDSAEAMEAFGACLATVFARRQGAGRVIHLHGELGAGKTTLTRGFLRALGHEGRVRSPTYTLVETYELADIRVHHFDLYRLTDPEELEYIGIRDLLTDDDVSLVEWPERGEGILPGADLDIYIEYDGLARRVLINVIEEGAAGVGQAPGMTALLTALQAFRDDD